MKRTRTYLILCALALSSLHAVEDPTRSTSAAEPKIAAGKAGLPVSLFYSSGDAIVAYKWLPMDSAATCKAAFAALHQHYNCDRVLWREANTEWIRKWNEVRADSPWLGDLTSDAIRINRDYKTTENAAREARANGMEFWGIFHLFDYSGKAECGSGGRRSQGAFYGRSPWLEEHPEYSVWDRAHITSMTAGVEYGEPAVRAEYVRRVDEMFQGAWSVYGGLLVYSFIENMEAHFTDEFIYSDYAVADFKRRFGLDVRTQPFDLEQYYAMRGGYITQYLRELRPIFLKHHKALAMVLNADNMETPQAWLAGRSTWPKDASVPFTLQQGRLKMDWRTWVKEGLVDELHVWAGVGPDQKCANVRAILEATKGTGIKVSVFYQTAFAAKDQDLETQGVRRAISVEPGNEEGDHAKHTAADIDSHDDAVVLRVLAQARAKEFALPGGKLTALLLKHTNPLVRRQAASTMGVLKLTDCISSLEDAAIHEPEGSVKAMVFDALGQVNGPHTVAALAQGFAKVNTFPVRMALRDTLAKLGPEHAAAISESHNTKDDYFRRVLLESFTRYNGTAESLAVIVRALHDPNDKVRWWAANAFQYQSVKAEHIEVLLAALDDASGAVQCRAAVSLTGMVRKMSDEMKRRCFEKLLARYREFDTGCKRSDAEWGWRPIGETLRDGFENQGKDALLTILNTGKTDLAKFTWRVFFQPNDEFWHPIAREDMEQKYRFYPGREAHGKCTLADLSFRSLIIGAVPTEPAPRDIRVGADVKTIREAIKLAQPGDTIHLQPITYYESADLTGKHGLPGKPITLDGHGAILDGSEPIKSAEWESLGHDLYRKVKLMPRMDDAIKGRWFFLFNGRMNRMGICSKGPSLPLKKPADLQPDEWTYVQDEDAFYLRLAAGQSLDAANIRYPARSSAVVQSISGSWLTVRNVTGTHVYNDGFNVHGEQRHLVYENIAALECGDDGFSAHEDAECEIDGFTSIGNATGLCDTVSSVTHYRNVFIKDCHGYDIYFDSDSPHSMENVVVESSAARVLEIASHAEKPQGRITSVTLKNMSIRRIASTPAEVRVGSSCRLTLDRCTLSLSGVNFIVTPRGAMNVQQSLFTGTPKPDLLLYANTIWQGAGNLFDLASLRVGQTSFTTKTFADFQKLVAGEFGSTWEPVTTVPDGVGADEAVLGKLKQPRITRP